VPHFFRGGQTIGRGKWGLQADLEGTTPRPERSKHDNASTIVIPFQKASQMASETMQSDPSGSRTASMENLPAELRDLIVDFCDFRSRKQLRLVNKSLCEAVTPLVFERFYTALFTVEVKRLRQFASTPLAKYVKHLTMFSDVLPDYDERTWRGKIDYNRLHAPWHQAQMRSAEASERRLTEGWQAFCELRKDQQQWNHQRHGCTFVLTINLLPNIMAVEVTQAKPFSGRTNDWPLWRRLRQQILVGPDEWMFSIHFATPSIETCKISSQATICALEAMAYRPAERAISRLEVNPWPTLGCVHMDDEPKMVWDLFTSTPPHLEFTRRGEKHASWYQRLVGKALARVKDLKIDVSIASGYDARTCAYKIRDEITRTLCVAKELRSLDVEFSDDEAVLRRVLPLDHVFSAHDEVLWPHLKHLSLSTNLSAQNFLSFLHQHSSTLRSLELRDMLIGDLGTVIRETPSILELQHIYLECVSHSADEMTSCFFVQGTDEPEPYEQSVKAWLLRQSEDMPPLFGGLEGHRLVDGK
jgi:hypothetical protein